MLAEVLEEAGRGIVRRDRLRGNWSTFTATRGLRFAALPCRTRDAARSESRA